MNAAQIHLALNHFPIAGMFFVFLLLILAVIVKKQELILAGMIIAIAAGIFIIPLNATGEGAEEIVEHKPLVTEHVIHEHEEAAEKALILVELTAICAIGWFAALKFKKDWCGKIEKSVLALSLVSLILIANAAHLGGMIRHDELRSGTTTSADKYED